MDIHMTSSIVIFGICIMLSVGHKACLLSSACFVWLGLLLLFRKGKKCSLNMVQNCCWSEQYILICIFCFYANLPYVSCYNFTVFVAGYSQIV